MNRVGMGRDFFTAVVLVERSELFVLVWNGHTLEIVQVSHRLEIAATNEQVNLHFFYSLQVRYGAINGV